MPTAYVKCLYCGVTFDRLKEPAIKIGRRYAHEACYYQQDEEELKKQQDEHNFFEYIK